MFKIHLDDEAIMDMEKEDEKVTQYRRYIMNRFMVMEKENESIFVADKEIGITQELKDGDNLADGTVQIKKEGIIFKPPRADQQPFVIPSREEFMPMASFQAEKDRIKLDDKLEKRHNDEMIILMVEDIDLLR